MEQVELILNKVIEFMQTPLILGGGLTLTVGGLLLSALRFFLPKNKQLKASEILITEQRSTNELLQLKIDALEQQNTILKEENAVYKESINTIAKRSRNREIQALAVEETPVQEETEMIKVKVVE